MPQQELNARDGVQGRRAPSRIARERDCSARPGLEAVDSLDRRHRRTIARSRSRSFVDDGATRTRPYTDPTGVLSKLCWQRRSERRSAIDAHRVHSMGVFANHDHSPVTHPLVSFCHSIAGGGGIEGALEVTEVRKPLRAS